MNQADFKAYMDQVSKLTLRQRRLLENELMARHMQEEWDERDNPEKEVAASVSFHA